MGNSGSISGRFFGLVFVVLAGMAGCQRSPGETGAGFPGRNDTLNLLYPGEPVSLDPSASLDAYAAVVLDHIFETLTRVDRSGAVVPAAATRWTVSSDGKTYTFTLRADGRWSDGKPVVADDFRRSWLRVLDPKNHFSHASKLVPYIVNAGAYARGAVGAGEVGIRSPDEHTLVVVLTNPASFFPQMVTYWCFAPLRLDVIGRAGPRWDTTPEKSITNGPYKLAEYKKGESVLMVRNDEYWNRRSIRIPAIRVFFQKPGQDPFQLFRDGEMDCISTVQAGDLPLVGDLQSDLHVDQALGTMVLFVNHQNPVLAQDPVRDALSRAVDRQKIVDEAVLRGGTPTRYFIPPSLVLAGQKFHDFTALNPPAVLSGAPGLDLKRNLRLYYKSGSVAGRVAALLADGWKRHLGIGVETVGMDWAQLVDRCQKGDYDLALMTYSAEYPHPMSFLGQFLAGGPGAVFTHWNDKAVQDGLMEAAATQDERTALDLLRSLESRIVDGHHIIPLYYTKVICLMADRVSGWYRTGIGTTGFTFNEASLGPR